MPSNTFVMVPVPEEFMHDVVQLIHRLNMQGGSGGTLQPWDEAAMATYFLEADEDTRSLLSIVARGTLAGKNVTDLVAADFMQLGQRETFEIVRRVRDSLASARRQQLVGTEVVEVALPSGRIKKQRVLTMQQDHARMVRVAEHAAEALEPNPLDQMPG